MKGETTLKILHALADAGIETAINITDFTAAFLEAGYGASGSRLDYFIEKRRRTREKKAISEGDKQKFFKLLYKLKKDDLIKRTEKRKGTISITEKGLEKLDKLKERTLRLPPSRNYEKQKEKDVKILIFDIPEKQRFKRDWLRIELLGLGFSKIQKSVWISKNKIPEEFLKDLKNLELLPYVEIFSINKSGSLEKILI